jgi:acyl carrier protein
MDDEKIYSQIVEILADIKGIDKGMIKQESNLMNDLGYDSLLALQLLMELESKFLISIPEEEVITINTPSEILTLVKSKMK